MSIKEINILFGNIIKDFCNKSLSNDMKISQFENIITLLKNESNILMSEIKKN